MKVLVAEDDPTLREEIAELLRSDGHQVRLAPDGTEAIRRLEAEPFDLALVDWNMPGKSGADVLRRAKEIRPKTAVIVMTGYGSVDTAVEALKSGAKDFLQKPFEIDVLTRTMESIRQELASRRAPEAASMKRPRRSGPKPRVPRARELKAAFLHSKEGLLIGAKVRPGEKTGDEDLLVATLNVIQNFMRISFPILKGKRLRAISQGNHTLVTEAGKHVFLTVVVRGEDSRPVRERLRATIRQFEERNRDLLAHWQGFVDQPMGAEELLTELLERPD